MSFTILSLIFTAPTSTSILNASSPIYFQTIVAAAKSESATGGLAANFVNMMQASIMIAPSKQTAAYPFRKLMPILCVGCPAKVESGIGAIAVYSRVSA